MTQETEDVVGRILRDYENGAMDAAGTIEDLVEYAQSLSDRIDVLARERDHWKAECKALCDVVSEHTKARAALHQEGIAMKSDPLRFGVETRVNLARSQNTPDSQGDG